MTVGSDIKLLVFKSCCLCGVRPWADYLFSLSLDFFFCKMG